MDIPISPIGSALKLGLQVVSAQRVPSLEVYAIVRSALGPLEEYGFGGDKSAHRREHNGIEGWLVNVGGQRAESIRIALKGDFESVGVGLLSAVPVLNGLVTIPQLAPAQSLLLFRLDMADLVDRKSGGMKTEGFSLAVRYDGPALGMNRLRRLPSRIRRRAQFDSSFRFDPRVYERLVFPFPDST